MSQRKWTKFFDKAGFSQNVANGYATIFHANGIEFDMLNDMDQVIFLEFKVSWKIK